MNSLGFEQEKAQHRTELLQVRYWMTPSPYCLWEKDTVQKAAEKMDELRVEGLPVVDESNRYLGMVTLGTIIKVLVKTKQPESPVSRALIATPAYVKPDDSIMDVVSHSENAMPVLDKQERLVGLITIRDALDGFFKYTYKLEQRQNTVDALHVILESAYEGIAVVDEHGVLLEFNKAYSRFTGVKSEDAIGRHVTEVIDNTNLHETVKTGIPERGVLQTIQGQDMIVHRIPIWQNGRVTGAIGMLIFEGVTDVYRIYERLQEEHRKKEPKIELLSLKKEKDSRITIDEIIGESDGILKVKRDARRSARTHATVLITGESGTGKEMFAKSIHHLSPFSTGPFISVNCGAIPEHLFESELFGYEEGAFTGARKGGKPGKFELAQNGTIFLDEIGEMPLVMQTKLLRVLQEREVERVGGINKYQMNVRIVCATNRDLKEMVNQAEFREDLFYRLNIIQLHIPPLRERKTDIPILLAHYLKEVCGKYQVPVKTFTSQAVAIFRNYSWRGNIREMVNSVERLVTMVDGDVIDVQHLPVSMREESFTLEKNSTGPSLIEVARDDVFKREKEVIIQALKNAGGNKSKAADVLGIHRTTLYQKLKKHGIH
ncbi:PAS domain S-box-containing protein [Mesobacillus persicus]|uniref:PAS domain S-box-containing protein n=1 Tax=Mesobacillus persicus TaxID=930146 RepID=A0A1H8B1Z1_9BACI|nr:sigma-54-dependent Fis family transcriptional regulator [Mesobacillus persicus]SEM76950.1 PAS domain S-box-containing protein [Mesobacillus persicus]